MTPTDKTISELAPDLLQATLLGQYPPEQGYARDEYQIGTRLVWVIRRQQESAQQAQERARELCAQAWMAIPAALSVAELASRNALPDAWLAHDLTVHDGQLLVVLSITLTPDEGTATYDIESNPELNWTAIYDIQSHLELGPKRTTFHVLDVYEEDPLPVPKLPDGHRIRVLRAIDSTLVVTSIR